MSIQTRELVDKTLKGIRLVRAGGEAQRGRPGSPLAEPQRVSALGPSGRPVPNLPLRALRNLAKRLCSEIGPTLEGVLE